MEHISVFDIIKIGVGPSSSHTMGPWRAAQEFVALLEKEDLFNKCLQINVELFGSLAKTGKGHGTDIAIMMGLSGIDFRNMAATAIEETIKEININQKINVGGKRILAFEPEEQIIFHFTQDLPGHPNSMRFSAYFENQEPALKTYYSLGGGFIQASDEAVDNGRSACALRLESAEEIAVLCAEKKLSFAELILEKEQTWSSKEEIRIQSDQLFKVMLETVYQACHKTGILPGGLEVSRRAAVLNQKNLKSRDYNNATEWMKEISKSATDFEMVLQWVSTFSLATNEENASFGRIVTAPTNGAAGVIPAVLLYLLCFGKTNKDTVRDFILVAGEIGALFKKRATISAAMGGCQAEIGVSSAMAAAALTACKRGTVEHCLMAAEIAMEHHLGLTCDPVGGLVQIPCIERNSMGAIKAITASNLALQSDPANAKVSLDSVIKTMWETALDMNARYKETSEAGLAINIAVNVPEC